MALSNINFSTRNTVEFIKNFELKAKDNWFSYIKNPEKIEFEDLGCRSRILDPEILKNKIILFYFFQDNLKNKFSILCFFRDDRTQKTQKPLFSISFYIFILRKKTRPRYRSMFFVSFVSAIDNILQVGK